MLTDLKNPYSPFFDIFFNHDCFLLAWLLLLLEPTSHYKLYKMLPDHNFAAGYTTDNLHRHVTMQTSSKIIFLIFPYSSEDELSLIGKLLNDMPHKNLPLCHIFSSLKKHNEAKRCYSYIFLFVKQFLVESYFVELFLSVQV